MKSNNLIAIKRINHSIVHPIEKAIIQTIVPYVPDKITPNILTTLGFLSSCIIAVLYVFASRYPMGLWLINVFMVLNWLGDGLDGRVAVFRRIEQPRLGFYLDHIVDASSVCVICIGITFSAVTNYPIWLVLGQIFLLFSIHSSLEAVTINKFTLSFGAVGPTEVRLLLIVINALTYFTGFTFLGKYKLFDIFSIFILIYSLSQFIITISSSIKYAQALDKGK